MRLGFFLALAGCNQIYGLEPTTIPDARPLGCPNVSAGQGAPQFSRVVRQSIQREFQHYHFNAEGTLAVGYLTQEYLVSFSIDEPPIMSTGITFGMGNPAYLEARPSPDGKKLYALEVNSLIRQIVIFDRQASTWVRRASPVLALSSVESFSTVFRGPADEDRLFVLSYMGPELVDYEVGTSFVERGRFPHPTEPTVVLNVTGDGLRAVFSDAVEENEYYTDRPSTEVAFRATSPIDVPADLYGQLTDDCSRYYFRDLRSIFYIEQ